MANYITTLKDDNEVDTLSPTTVLKAVRDDNGNYLDSGLAASDINKLKGGEVAKLEENLARIETSPTTHAYSVGERLVYNGILYRVKAAISIGDNLVVDTNIEKKSVDDALSDISVPIFHTLTTTNTKYTLYSDGNQHSYYCEIGRMVFVEIVFTCVTPQSGSSQLFSLPKSAESKTIHSGQAEPYQNSNAGTVDTLLQDGIFYVSGGVAGFMYGISFFYIKQ